MRSEIRLKIILILSNNEGHKHGEMTRLLGTEDKEYDGGNLTKVLGKMVESGIIYKENDNYFIVPSEETFSSLIHQGATKETKDFLNPFLISEYLNSLIGAIGFNNVYSVLNRHFDDRDFCDFAVRALLQHPATINEYKILPKKITEYFNSMENREEITKAGKSFRRAKRELDRNSDAYKYIEEAFKSEMKKHSGIPYDYKLGKIDELETLRNLGRDGVCFYRKNLLNDIVAIFSSRTKVAKEDNSLIKYVILDNYLSPFTAYPVNHPIELMFKRPFERLYEDAYIIDSKDIGLLLKRANLIFENFLVFSRIYSGRVNIEAIVRELILNWNKSCARFEFIFKLLGQLGYDREESCFHLVSEGKDFQIIDLKTDQRLLGESDMEEVDDSNLNAGFYEFDQTQFMRPVLMEHLGTEWDKELVPIETIIARIKNSSC
jgi:hypothetical protein